MKKRGFFVIAALFLFVTLFPLGAYAADVYAILYEDGEMVFQYGDTPETGRVVTKTYPVDLTAVYEWGSYPWYNKRLSVYAVTFADIIKPVSTAYWFYECYNLQRIDNIHNLDTSNVTDMCSMFYGCSNLTTLDVSGFNTSNVTNMSDMFRACKGLTALDLSHFNTANVMDMSLMFYNCSGLTELDVSSFDTSNVKDMSVMFWSCSSLTTLNLSSFNTSNVTDMNTMFQDCSNLMTLDVSGFDTSNVTNMRYMFSLCPNLMTLDISDFDTSRVTDMSGVFSGCSKLTTIYTSDKFKTVSVTDSNFMFTNCMALIGGAGTIFDGTHTDMEYARIDTLDAPGYFTAKYAAPVAYAITAAAPENGKLSVTLTNPGAATLAVSYFADNGKFVSAILQSVDANAGTVTLELAAGAKTARVMLLDSDFRPLCAAYSVGL